MIPELQTAVVIMTNSLALNDCPDWVMQLVLEQLLDAPQRNDYIAAAKTSIYASLDWHQMTADSLYAKRKNGPSTTPYEAYVGTYWNKQRYLKIEVTMKGWTLYWALQGLESEKFGLAPFEDDTYLWIGSRNKMAARGRWVDQPPIFWKIKFRSNEQGEITVLNWAHDPDVPDGEDFFRET